MDPRQRHPLRLAALCVCDLPCLCVDFSLHLCGNKQFQTRCANPFLTFFLSCLLWGRYPAKPHSSTSLPKTDTYSIHHSLPCFPTPIFILFSPKQASQHDYKLETFILFRGPFFHPFSSSAGAFYQYLYGGAPPATPPDDGKDEEGRGRLAL